MFHIAVRAARSTSSSNLSFALFFLALGLAGILLSMYLGITPPDAF